LRWGVRGRVLFFFVALAIGCLAILVTGIWFGYHRASVSNVYDAFAQAGIAMGFGFAALLLCSWVLFDRYFARPVKSVAAAMQARAYADVGGSIDVTGAKHLGELPGAVSQAIATLRQARSDLAETVARETSQLLADKGKLEQMLSDVPPAILLCTGRHHIAFYNSVAQQMLGTPHMPICLDRNLFDYLADHEVRHVHRRLMEQAAPDTVVEFTCAKGSRRLAGRMRLAENNDGDAGAYVMTLRDVTEEIAAFARRDLLLRDVFNSPRPAEAFGEPTGRNDGAWADLKRRYQACEAEGWPTTLSGTINSPVQTGHAPAPISNAPRAVVYDFDLLSRKNREIIADAGLDELNYVVFDTETTGLFPERGDELVQIAAVRIVNGKLMLSEIFDTLVNPGRRISSASTAIHGVTEAMVADAPDVLRAVEQFHKFAEGCVLVAHNSPFDMAFLQRRERALGIQFCNPVLDTGILSTMMFGRHESHTLDALISRLGISLPTSKRHTALGDAIATAEAFVKLKAMMMGKGIARFGDIAEAFRKIPDYRRRTHTEMEP
jgi:DNA polymerase-3 subunit epsilon